MYRILAAAILLFATDASAALNSYLTITGETQGEIRGGATQAGREDTIEVIGWSHEVVSPRDAAGVVSRGGWTLPHRKLAPEKNQHNVEEVSFYYERIVWTFHDGGVTAEDDWQASGDG